MHLIVLSPQYLLLIEDSYQSVEPVGRSRITAHITLGHYMCAPRENSTATILSCKMASSGYTGALPALLTGRLTVGCC